MNAAYPPHSRLAGGGSRAGPGPARAPVLAVLYARELGRRGAHRPLRLGAPAGALAPLLTVDEHLRLFGAVGGTGRARSVSTGHRLLSRLGWYPEGARAAGALSGGTQQKLNVAWPSSTPRTCCSSTSPTRASTPWPTRTCGR